MNVLETKIRVLKSKLIKHFRTDSKSFQSDAMLAKSLKQATYSLNHTKTRSGIVPALTNHSWYDPYLRQVLFPHHHLEPFEKFYAEQLKLQKRVSKPNPKAVENMSSSYKTFRINDLVFVDFTYNYNLLRPSYRIQRGNMFRIARIDTRSTPWIFKLKSLADGDEIPGWFYGKELSRASLTDLQVEKVLKTKITKKGVKEMLVTFKGYGDDYNKWISEDDLRAIKE